MRATGRELRAWMIAGLGGDARAQRTLLRELAPLLRTFFARRLRQEVPLADLEAILAGPGFEDASGARMDVDRLLGLVPAKQAAAIRATRLDGLSIAEAAARGGIGESDVKISVHRGLKTLAVRLEL